MTAHSTPAAHAHLPSTANGCVACGSEQNSCFFKIDSLPVHVGVLHDSREAALSAPMGSVALVYCQQCGLVHNRAFDPSLTNFAPGYEAALHHSPVFREFIEDVANRLIDRYALRGKRVFEIGCGDGYFLKRLCSLGANHGVGVDPTVARNISELAGRGTVSLFRDFFTERFVRTKCDFVCCLSVFEDIPNPVEFLARVRRTVTGPDIPIYFEVFNAFSAFERMETWSVHYEQCNYFSQASLVALFQRCGFEVIDAGTCYQGDQYLFVEARLADSTVPAKTEVVPLPEAVANFSQHYQKNKVSWQQRLDSFRRQGDRVVLWGLAAKVSVFSTL